MISRSKLRLTPTLTTLIGTFVLLTASLVLAVQALTSEKILRSLGANLVVVSTKALEAEFNERLDGIEEQARFASRALIDGSILLDREEELTSFLYGTLAGTPEAQLILVIKPDGQTLQVDRTGPDDVLVPKRAHMDRSPDLQKLEQDIRASPLGRWSEVEYIAARQYSYASFAVPILDNGTYKGLVLVGVSLADLSQITRTLSHGALKVFLMLGNDRILAHPQLEDARKKLSHHEPLLALEHSPDNFLADLNKHETFESDGLLPSDMSAKIGTTRDGETRFMVLVDTQRTFGNETVKLGVHFPSSVLQQPFEQLHQAMLIGLALLGLALVGAGLLAHFIATPIRRAAASARAVATLDLDRVPTLPGNPVRELNDLATGFNSMVSGLNAFLRYMPRSLVTKLVSEGVHEAPPEGRTLSVLFTDIAGFTQVSEGMSPEETASFINHHLTLIGQVIDQHAGTIDKYIGDSVMAFWGAPKSLEDPAVPAALAALDIARALKQDNLVRRQAGLEPVRIRIGVHKGPLIVGDIGAPGRVNYTVIGDTVNAASRLESLGKDVDEDAEVCVLVSRQIADSLPPAVRREDLGPRSVKGRQETLDVVRLYP
ncbi:HAMP domain-containing protein [Roseibium sp. CAU 1637]|uniref:HAMP domain-containing protein n=1 Tax=Roseibium limicola TaxID=2816037 RepID=A0A939EMH2_9HYPH|nr:HAMP domain-containing protein [Roseibium limicola]